MKKDKKNRQLEDFSEYIEQGIEEEGKERNLEVEVTTIVKTKQGKMPQSVIVIQAFALELAYRTKYGVNTFRVLFYFISLSEFENFISIDVKSISEDLGISIPSVKRATKQLSDDNIIIKTAHPTDKRRVDYFLNPMAMWKGKTLKRDKFLLEAKRNKMQLDLFTS